MEDRILNIEEERAKQARYEKMEKCRIENRNCATCDGEDVNQIECKYFIGVKK